MTFPDIAAKPALAAESRVSFFCHRTREIWLIGHLWNIENSMLEVKICRFLLPQTREIWLIGHLWNIESMACWKLKFVFIKYKV